MSLTVIGIIGIVLLIALLFTDMPVGFVMAIVGFAGFSYIKGFGPGLIIVAKDVFEVFSSYGLTVVPLFVFMGQLSFYSGISKRLFESAYVVMGSRRGGLAMATVGACAGFSAISGSTNATAATMATVTLPEMERYGYDMGLATGTVAAAGSLGILIPPSTVFIIYGILTEQSIGKLFAAGIIPGILLSILFLLVIYIRVKLNPDLAPPGPKTSFKEKIKSFVGVIETIILFGNGHGRHIFRYFHPYRSGRHRRLFHAGNGACPKAVDMEGVPKGSFRYDSHELHDHGHRGRRYDFRSFYGGDSGAVRNFRLGGKSAPTELCHHAGYHRHIPVWRMLYGCVCHDHADHSHLFPCSTNARIRSHLVWRRNRADIRNGGYYAAGWHKRIRGLRGREKDPAGNNFQRRASHRCLRCWCAT